MSTKCDICGKEVDKVSIHNLVDGGKYISICPDCWDEFLHPKNFGDVIKLDPNQVSAFNQGLDAGVEMAADKEKQAIIEALNRIGDELHEINERAKRREQVEYKHFT